MAYANVGNANRLGKYGNKAKEYMGGRNKLLETLKPWVCCSKPRHNNKTYNDLEKSADSSGAYSISNPIPVEVNGKSGDVGKPRTTSAQEMPASPVPKRLDESFNPKLPALDNNGSRRTFDFFHYKPPSQNRITQIIDSYGEYDVESVMKESGAHQMPARPPSTLLKMDDERLRHEIEFIRAASRKHPENAELSAAAEATYLVDENGEPRPEMIDALDRVLGGGGRTRNSSYLSGSTEISSYSERSGLIQPLRPKPAQLRNSDQPRQLLRSMDERKVLELRLLNIQRALTQRKKDKQDGKLDASVKPLNLTPQPHEGSGNRELIDELIDDFYDDDAQITKDCDDIPMFPKPPEPSAQPPRRTPALSAIARPRNTFRRSNPLDDSRNSMSYSEYVYEEYGVPSPSIAVFSGEDEPSLMRSVSQRPPVDPPLRRTRSSESIAPVQPLMLSRNESMISAPGARLDRWLNKQEEYFGGETQIPIPLSTLPQEPKISGNSVKHVKPRRNSISYPEEFPPVLCDTAVSSDPRFPTTEENSSCVGIPYSAMLRKEMGSPSVVSANSSHTHHAPPPNSLPQFISELEAIPSGTGKQRAMEETTSTPSTASTASTASTTSASKPPTKPPTTFDEMI